MLAEALPLAAAGSVYPVGFAAVTAQLGMSSPLKRAFAFLAGGAFISFIGYTVIVTVSREADVTPLHHPTAVAIIKVVLGVALLALAARTIVRHRRAADVPATDSDAAKPPPVDEARIVRRAFISGMLVYFPGVFLLASAKAIADANASVVTSAGAAILCVIVLLAIAELPVITYMIAPDRTRSAIQSVTAIVKRHSYAIIVTLEIGGGLYLLFVGIKDI